MSDILWKLTDVTVLGRHRPRLDHVSLEIQPGVTAVLGPSGAGKTTLLNLLVEFERPSAGRVERLIPRRPHSPSAEVRHSESAGYENAVNGNRLPVFWVPPGHGLWPQVTVRNHLASIAPEASSSPANIDGLLQAFDLDSLAGAYPATLSQGERDRLSLARAIASGAEVLVLDEPLAHLPAEAARRYWSQLRTACQQQKMSLVLATHDTQVASREASRVIVLESGKVIVAGSVEELLRAESESQNPGFGSAQPGFALPKMP